MNQRREMLKKALLLPVAAAAAGGAAVAVPASAQAAGTWNTAVVPVNGTVGGAPESVAFAGNAKINTRLAHDPDFGKPSLIMAIDLSEVSGVGASTQRRYAISGPSMVQKRHAESHVVEISFAFFPAGSSGVTDARSGIGTFSITVNTATGVITAANGKLGTAKT